MRIFNPFEDASAIYINTFWIILVAYNIDLSNPFIILED